MRLTKTMLAQLAYVARLTPSGGATTSGCGNGDFNRYMRLEKAGLVAFRADYPQTNLVITDAGRAVLNARLEATLDHIVSVKPGHAPGHE